MNLRRISLISTLLTLIFSLSAYGQIEERIYTDRAGELLIGDMRMDKFKVLDNSKIVVTYSLELIIDTLKNDVVKERMVLLVGEKQTKFYSEYTYLDNLSYTNYELGRAEPNQGYGISQDNYIEYDIFRDLQKQQLTVVHRIPFEENRAAQYEESVPSFEWTFGDQSREIAGYECMKATTSWGGREWRVWFTQDVPIDAGPWKFSGLPGLILAAEDSQGHYVLKCIGIEQKVEPIKWYTKWRYRKMSKEEWRTFDKNVHAAPSVVMGNGGNRTFYSSGADGKSIQLGTDWSVPFNPIER